MNLVNHYLSNQQPTTDDKAMGAHNHIDDMHICQY